MKHEYYLATIRYTLLMCGNQRINLIQGQLRGQCWVHFDDSETIWRRDCVYIFYYRRMVLWPEGWFCGLSTWFIFCWDENYMQIVFLLNVRLCCFLQLQHTWGGLWCDGGSSHTLTPTHVRWFVSWWWIQPHTDTRQLYKLCIYNIITYM